MSRYVKELMMTQLKSDLEDIQAAGGHSVAPPTTTTTHVTNIVHIPAGIPHSFLVPTGKHLTYVLLKIPAKP